MKSSYLARTLELAKLAAKVGLKEIKSNDFNSRIEQAVLIAKSLSQLKGAAMKVGQLLSLDLDNYFPPEAIQILSQLQSSAIALPYSEIEKIINKEIPPVLRQKLTSIQQEPIGVASIAQVHKARYLNEDIVLKVQFSDIAKTIDSDLKILKTIASSFVTVTGRKMNLDPVFSEFKTILEQEINYSSEAQFQEKFRLKVEALNKTAQCIYRVPEVIKDLSTEQILAMKFETGLTFRNWLSNGPSLEEKHTVAVAILDLYFHEFFEWGLVQTDPNWGNFLVDKVQNKINICLLDFGATKEYTKDFVGNYIQLLEAAAQDNHDDLKTKAIHFGLMDARESDAAFAAFEAVIKTAIQPFFTGASGFRYFDFADRNYTIESQNTVKALYQELIYSPPPYKIIFLHRKLAGVYSILKSLEVKLDISSYWNVMKDLSKRDN